MAIDNTPPRLKLIVTIAVMTIITLVGLNFVFTSYYEYMLENTEMAKLAPPKQLEAQHTAEEQAFKTAAMPLDKAMAQVAKGTRSELIAPQQSEDLGPMTGWSKLPKPAPVAQPGAGASGHGHDAVDADGGALATGDAGAPTSTGDAGAPHHAGDAGAAPHHAGDAGAGGAVRHPTPPPHNPPAPH